MKKKEMLKEQERLKKERNNVNYLDFSDNKTVSNTLFVALGVILFIGLVFCVVNIFNGTWNIFTRDTEKEPSIDENLVLCGTMYDMEKEYNQGREYLVLAFDFSDEEQEIYSLYRSSYGYGEKKIYMLDLHSGFNKSCVSNEKSNIVSNLNELKISEPTLLRIKDEKILGSITGKDKIKKYLEEIR